jgi:H+/Cl- antiporter ClcA
MPLWRKVETFGRRALRREYPQRTHHGTVAIDDTSRAAGELVTIAARAKPMLQWTGLGLGVGIASGVASALFLTLLDRATRFREAHQAIVYGLPLAGLAIGLVYERWGSAIRGGNNLIIDTIHDDAAQIPARMAPMVLIGTVLTHFFGGSAGREGTAVQMGASFADEIAHRFAVDKDTRRHLLAAGIAGGFSAVFGTPIAGTLFGLEVVSIGRMDYGALVPALVAAISGDYVTRHLGVVHTAYPQLSTIQLSVSVLGKLIVIGVGAGLATTLFVEATHHLKRVLEARLPRLPLRMCAGGLLVVVLWKLIGTSDYLGLGVPVIVRAFGDPELPVYAFALKLVFTAVTLASGFLGGEVTPLFFVGATLGNVLARFVGLPIALGAAVGVAAVFGSAANTPIALSIMAVELLGAAAFPHVVIVCVVAYLVSGHRGIYPAQRILQRKHGGVARQVPVALRDMRALPGLPDQPERRELNVPRKTPVEPTAGEADRPGPGAAPEAIASDAADDLERAARDSAGRPRS